MDTGGASEAVPTDESPTLFFTSGQYSHWDAHNRVAAFFACGVALNLIQQAVVEMYNGETEEMRIQRQRTKMVVAKLVDQVADVGEKNDLINLTKDGYNKGDDEDLSKIFQSGMSRFCCW